MICCSGYVQRRALDNIGSSLLEKKAFANWLLSKRALNRLGSSLLDNRALYDDRMGPLLDLDHAGDSLLERRSLDSIGSSLIDRRSLDKIGSSLLRKRAG